MANVLDMCKHMRDVQAYYIIDKPLTLSYETHVIPNLSI